MPHPRQTPTGTGTDIGALLRTEIDLNPRAKEAWEALAPATRRAVTDALDDVESFTGTASVELGWRRPPLGLRRRPRLTIRTQDSGWSAMRHVVVIDDERLTHARELNGETLLDQGSVTRGRLAISLSRMAGMTLVEEPVLEMPTVVDVTNLDGTPIAETRAFYEVPADDQDIVVLHGAVVGMLTKDMPDALRRTVASAVHHVVRAPEGLYARVDVVADVPRLSIGNRPPLMNDLDEEAAQEAVDVTVEPTRITRTAITRDEDTYTLVRDLTVRELIKQLASIPGVEVIAQSTPWGVQLLRETVQGLETEHRMAHPSDTEAIVSVIERVKSAPEDLEVSMRRLHGDVESFVLTLRRPSSDLGTITMTVGQGHAMVSTEGGLLHVGDTSQASLVQALSHFPGITVSEPLPADTTPTDDQRAARFVDETLRLVSTSTYLGSTARAVLLEVLPLVRRVPRGMRVSGSPHGALYLATPDPDDETLPRWWTLKIEEDLIVFNHETTPTSMHRAKSALSVEGLHEALSRIPGVVLAPLPETTVPPVDEASFDADGAASASPEAIMERLTAGRTDEEIARGGQPGPKPGFVRLMRSVLAEMKDPGAFEVSFLEDSTAVFTLHSAGDEPSQVVTVSKRQVCVTSNGRRWIELRGSRGNAVAMLDTVSSTPLAD